jgi:hypothetical protein
MVGALGQAAESRSIWCWYRGRPSGMPRWCLGDFMRVDLPPARINGVMVIVAVWGGLGNVGSTVSVSKIVASHNGSLVCWNARSKLRSRKKTRRRRDVIKAWLLTGHSHSCCRRNGHSEPPVRPQLRRLKICSEDEA